MEHWRDRGTATTREERCWRRVQHAVARLAKRAAEAAFRTWLFAWRSRNRGRHMAKRALLKMAMHRVRVGLEVWRDET